MASLSKMVALRNLSQYARFVLSWLYIRFGGQARDIPHANIPLNVVEMMVRHVHRVLSINSFRLRVLPTEGDVSVFRILGPENVDLGMFHTYEASWRIAISGVVFQAILEHGWAQGWRIQISGTDDIRRIRTYLLRNPIDAVDNFLHRMETNLTSQEEIDLNSFIIRVGIYRPGARARVGGYRGISFGFDDFCKKRCILVVPQSDENDCFYQALVYGLCDIGHAYMIRYHMNQLKKGKLRSDMARKLRDEMGLTVRGEMFPLEHVNLVEDKLEIAIMLIDYATMKIQYPGSVHYDKRVTLIYTSSEYEGTGHVNYVRAKHVGAVWDYRQFCESCMKGYQDERHVCIVKCYGCLRPDCEGTGKEVMHFEVTCEDCLRKFYNSACFGYHLGDLCKKMKICSRCRKVLKGKKKQGTTEYSFSHECERYRCTNCQTSVANGMVHKCYHQQNKIPDKRVIQENIQTNGKYIFYDFEAYATPSGKHEVALVVAMYSFSEDVFIFESMKAFGEWLFDVKKHKNFTCIAHNAGRYDFHFVKEFMLENHIKSSDLVHGNRYLRSYVPKVGLTFIDSLRHIPLALRVFPKTFGIHHIEKGYFPYRFFTRENGRYHGKMPDLEWFDFGYLKQGEFTKAIEWWQQHQNDEIDLYQVCVEYCCDDVRLLKEGCMRHRNMFLQMTDGALDPFKYTTTPSVCMALYRMFHMPTQTIAVLNHMDVHFEEYVEQWIRYMVHTKQLMDNYEKKKLFPWTQHAVDAYVPTLKIAYKFLNCIDWGCRKCKSREHTHPSNFSPMYELYSVFLKMCDQFREHEVDLRVKWRCEWVKNTRHEAPLIQFIRENDFIAYKPLVIRDAFYGGRVEPFKLYRAVRPGEKIRYYDVTSMYPAVQNCEFNGISMGSYDQKRVHYYPVGHPQRIMRNELSMYFVQNRLNELPYLYFGFILCYIVPPKDLYIPVLPEKKDGKLMFDLTPKKGTWTTVELQKAIECGYIIKDVYEILHFEEKSSELFKSYVSTFMKLKQEAKGWNQLRCFTDEQKVEYIREYETKMGIRLDPSKIGLELNDGLYFISKLCLNSHWGKYGQRDEFNSTEDVFTDEDFDRIVFNDENEVRDVVVHDHLPTPVRTITYSNVEDSIPYTPNTNIAIAAFTTSYGRLRLYEILEAVGPERVLYCDTDSVKFVDDGNVDLCCGECLGDLTDELNDNEWIEEFVSSGPKAYAYRTNQGRECIRVKGITLNKSTMDLFSVGVMKDLVYDSSRKRSVLTRPLTIDADSFHHLITKDWGDNGKIFRVTFDKRTIAKKDDYVDTYPLGYEII